MSTSQQYLDTARVLKNDGITMLDKDATEARKKLQIAVSYLNMAIKYSESPCPEAYEELAIVMSALGEPKKAKQYAITAANLSPNSFNLRVLLFHLEVEEYVNATQLTSNQALGSTLFTLGVNALRESNKKDKIRSLVQGIVGTYYHTIRNSILSKNNVDLDLFISMSETMFDVGEFLRALNVREDSVYKSMLAIPWDQIEPGDSANKISEIKIRAEGNLAAWNVR